MSPWIGPGRTIVEAARFQARQHRHLRAAFDLEHADRVGEREHVVDRFVFLRQRGERIVLAVMLRQEIEPAPQAAQHAEREHVDLHQAERVDIVLVPFDEGPLVHGGISNGDGLVERFAGEHEAADMLREVARESDQFVGKDDGLADRRIIRIEPGLADVIVGEAVAIAPHRLGERGGDVLGQAQNLADFADGAAGAVMHDSRADRRAVAAVALVDVLDHLLAPLVLEIDVDVGRLAAVL
jgi:hypothetical protein